MSDALEAHASHFRKQAEWCDRLGSPFNAALLSGLADGLGDGGALDGLLMDGPEPLAPNAADAGPLRVAGALHALVLTGADADLAAHYPSAHPNWQAASTLVAAQAALTRHTGWVADFLTRPPQTNETRRSIGLLPGFAALAHHGPLHMLEVGASAGLNLNWDAFTYRTAQWSRAGTPGGPVIDTDWQGPAPNFPAAFEVASRRGCDQDPMDITDPETRLRLRAYIWPDQADRLARIDAALALADKRPIAVDKAGAADWLETQLVGPLPEGTTIVYHSIAWQYFDPETHNRAMAAIRSAGERADPNHRLAWLRFEHERLFDPDGSSTRHVIDLVEWPGRMHTPLAHADPHCRAVSLNSG
ncbi:MAG: DUF2332 domain-containing protein [Pseudomonadota bacterium]